MERNKLTIFKTATTAYFQKLLTPYIPIIISILIFFILEYTGGPTLRNINDCLLLASFVGLFITSICHFIKGNSLEGWFQILSFAIGGFATVCLVSFFSLYNPVDGYANFLEIPEGIEIHNPVDLEFRDSIRKIVPPKEDFQLYNSVQAGIYEFDAWIKPTQKGTLFLKAFEVTAEDQLSAERLRKRTEVKVKMISDSIKVFSTQTHFTIYEGDWGEPYAARFELWLKPETKKQEVKLMEKTFRIEGWQR